MFQRAASKLEDARANVDSMRRATSAPEFRSAFNSFLGNCRAVTYALQKEGAHVDGFAEWYAGKQEEMKDDELLRFVHESRGEDFHEGKHRLAFSTHIQHLSTDDLGPPPEPGASLAIGADGPFWIVGEGTPRERRVPITQGSQHTINVAVANPPTRHRGQPLERLDPLSLCDAAADYMADLIYEARQVCI